MEYDSPLFIAAVRKILRDVMSGGEDTQTPQSGDKTQGQQQQSNPDIPVALGRSSLPPTDPHYHVTCDVKKDLRDKFKWGFEILGICILAVYTFYTIRIFCASKKSAKAAADAANTAAIALNENKQQFQTTLAMNQHQFADTLGQMKEQTASQIKAVATARTANILAQKSLEAQTRPWIGIDRDPQIISQEPQTRNQGRVIGPTINLAIRLRNYGQSPGIKVAAKFQLRGESVPRDLVERSKTCEDAVNDSKRESSIKEFIGVFPGDGGVVREEMTADSDSTNPNVSAHPQWLVGCIVYQRSGIANPYQTQVIYRAIPHPAGGPDHISITGLQLFDTEPK